VLWRLAWDADPSIMLRVYTRVIRDQVAAAADIFAGSIPAGDQAVLANLLARRQPPSGEGPLTWARSEVCELRG